MSDINLVQLQNKIKRDFESYKEEFDQQITFYESQLQILLDNPAETNNEFGKLLIFLSQTSVFYKSTVVVKGILNLVNLKLDQDITHDIINALMIFNRNKQLCSFELLVALFKLLQTSNKVVIKLLHKNIIQIITNKKNSPFINSKIQNYIYQHVSVKVVNELNDSIVKNALIIVVKLFVKNITNWNDAKSINILSNLLVVNNLNAKLINIIVNFLLHNNTVNQEDEEITTNNMQEINQLKHSMNCNKKTKYLLNKYNKAVKKKKGVNLNNSCTNKLMFFNDPQTVVEKLYQKLQNNSLFLSFVLSNIPNSVVNSEM